MRCDSSLRCAIVASALLGLFTIPGCGGGGISEDGAQVAGTTKAGKKLSADDQAAAEFVLAELKKHWVKTGDSWTTEFQQYNVLGEVMPDLIPDTQFRQLREFKYSIEPEQPSESMKLNGTDYRASVNFESTSERFFNRVETWEGPKGWSLWKDVFPSFGMAVERRNGQWIISDSDLWRGILPDAASVPTS